MKYKFLSMLAAGLLAFGATAHASLVNVGFSTTSIGPLTYFGDTFSESGMSGTLVLDDSGLTTNQVNVATLNVGDSGFTNTSQNVTLSFDLTLGGVTHTLSQNAVWSITPSQDQILAFDASTDVLFGTSSGSWLVHLNSFSMVARNIGTFRAPVTADFQAVPEPASLALVGISLLGLAALRRRRAI